MTDNHYLSVFTPSRTSPEDLERIFVQRQMLLEDAVERVRESALTKNKHHLLFVGPRGCGKTHLITLLVNRVAKDRSLDKHLYISWLNEDETATNVLELLLKIFESLNKRYPDTFRRDLVESVYDLKADEAQSYISQVLLSLLDDRTLLVVVENLDSLLENLGDTGQKKLRALIQEHAKFTFVATAQKLGKEVSDRTKPFFGFFQTEHLKSLTFDEAKQLLINIAILKNQTEAVAFLRSNKGKTRVRALHHLTGGNHRIYVVLSQFITRDSIDVLVDPFIKMVDELTPYYQERLRWLPAQQRKIVEFLCTTPLTVTVKDVARRLFATHQTISSQLKTLRHIGYVQSEQRGRESLYQISEPLMRICVEAKENQNYKPLRLIVDFLRVWYDEKELSVRLGRLEGNSSVRAYLENALELYRKEGDLRKSLVGTFDKEGRELEPQSVNRVSEKNIDSKIIRLTEVLERNDLAADELARALVRRGIAYGEQDQFGKEEADYTAVIDRKDAPIYWFAWALNFRGKMYEKQDQFNQALADYSAVIDLKNLPVKLLACALIGRGSVYEEQGQLDQAQADYSALIGLEGTRVDQLTETLINRGLTYAKQGYFDLALADYTAVIGLKNASIDRVAIALDSRGDIYFKQGQFDLALVDYTAIIGIKDVSVDQLGLALIHRCLSYVRMGQFDQAIADATTLIGLKDISVDQLVIALTIRGRIYGKQGQIENALSDFDAINELEEVSNDLRADGYLLNAELQIEIGKWDGAIEKVDSSLSVGIESEPKYTSSTEDLIAAFFSSYINTSTLEEKVKQLTQLYDQYNAVASLGEGLLEYIGKLSQSDNLHPSTDSLELWSVAWQKAGHEIAAFDLPLKLFNTGIEYLKNGKDESTLLSLNNSDRAILKQALRLVNQ